jgi:hypothetical protein
MGRDVKGKIKRRKKIRSVRKKRKDSGRIKEAGIAQYSA